MVESILVKIGVKLFLFAQSSLAHWTLRCLFDMSHDALEKGRDCTEKKRGSHLTMKFGHAFATFCGDFMRENVLDANDALDWLVRDLIGNRLLHGLLVIRNKRHLTPGWRFWHLKQVLQTHRTVLLQVLQGFELEKVFYHHHLDIVLQSSHVPSVTITELLDFFFRFRYFRCVLAHALEAETGRF